MKARVSDTRMVRVTDIQGNPDNPVERELVGEEFVASIRSVGVLVDLLLVPVGEWTTRHPEHADLLSDAPYVVVAGNRRRAAALLAEVDEVPARIRADLDAETLDSVILHENLHRAELAPSHEAMAYRRMMDRHGLSQRALSKHTGVPQSQISKKLRLLELPGPVRELVDDGTVGIEASLEVLNADPDVMEEVARLVTSGGVNDRMDIPWLIDEATQSVRQRVLEEKARQEAAERNAPFVDDPATLKAMRLLRDDNDISEAQASGHLVVSALHFGYGTGRVGFYSTQHPEKVSTGVNDLEAETKAEDKARRQAVNARKEFLHTFICDPAPTSVMRAAVVAHTLTGAGYGSDVSRILIPMLQHAGVLQDGEDVDYYSLGSRLAALPERDQLRAAWIVCVAQDEFRARAQWTEHWGTQDVSYLDRLIKAGYQPTPWEQKRLERSRSATGVGESA